MANSFSSSVCLNLRKQKEDSIKNELANATKAEAEAQAVGA